MHFSELAPAVLTAIVVVKKRGTSVTKDRHEGSNLTVGYMQAGTLGFAELIFEFRHLDGSGFDEVQVQDADGKITREERLILASQ